MPAKKTRGQKKKATKLAGEKAREVSPAKREKAVRKKAKEPKIDEFEQQKRINNMNRDKHRYALVDFALSDELVNFRLVCIEDGRPIKIKIDKQTTVSCSCMDFIMRCRKNNLNCKHIIYIANQIMKLENYDAFRGNKVADFDSIADKFDRIRANFIGEINERFKVSEDKQLTEEDLCPICFTTLCGEPKENMLACDVCRGIVHTDCMRCWMANAVKKSCVYCRGENICRALL